MAEDLPEVAPSPQESGEPKLELPEVSAVAGPATTSAPPGLTEEKLNELLEARFSALTEQLERREQSIKDRRIAKIETRLDELLALREKVEAKGGWDNVISEAEQAQTIEERLSGLIDQKLSQVGVGKATSSEDGWRSEWDTESRKMLDAADKLGIKLTTEEYNAALFGKRFATKGDAYAALNQAIVAKAKQEAVPATAVAVEGGSAGKPQEEKSPATWRQNFDKAMTTRDDKKAREILDKRWADFERQRKLDAARRAAAEAGVQLPE